MKHGGPGCKKKVHFAGSRATLKCPARSHHAASDIESCALEEREGGYSGRQAGTHSAMACSRKRAAPRYDSSADEGASSAFASSTRDVAPAWQQQICGAANKRACAVSWGAS